MANNLEIANFEEVLTRFEDIADVDLTQAMRQVGAFVEAEAKKNVTVNMAVDTGELRNSITYKATKDSCEVYTNKEYAPYVEVGTGLFAGQHLFVSQFAGTGRKEPWVYFNERLQKYFTTAGYPPRPFLSPALFKNREKVKGYISKAIDDAMRG